ncbi:MAG: DUF1573 domain-containing protein [Phycisphaerae bacterium]|nr:DUF1573 domain-containing protein [Phycisphaerae bacterium]
MPATATQAPVTPAATEAPVRAEPTKINFGIKSPGSTADSTVKLVNLLDRPVKILNAVPSCQCTGVDITGKEIPANGSIEFPISIKLSKAPVKKMADLKVMFEGFPRFVLRIELEAEVAYPIRATPGFLDVQQQVNPPMPLSGTFTLAASDGKPFSVIAVQGGPPALIDFTPGTDAPRAAYTLRYDFTAAADPNAGKFVPPYLIIETDRPDCPIIDLRVRHETTKISPKLKVHEYRSTFGRIAPGTSGEFDLEIENMKSQRVTGIKSLSPQAVVELVDQVADDKGSVSIKVKVTPTAGATGLLFFPIEISAGAISTRHLVIGAVR